MKMFLSILVLIVFFAMANLLNPLAVFSLNVSSAMPEGKGADKVEVFATGGTPEGGYQSLFDAFDMINQGHHTGNIQIKINDNLIEIASAVLFESGYSGGTLAPFVSSYTAIAIYPTVSGLSITGDMELPLIDLDGADNVTIDGRVNATGDVKDLVISNTNASTTLGTSTIRFINDASSNTVKYCKLKGSSTAARGGVLIFGSTTGTTGNDDNTIEYNDITNAGGNMPKYTLYSMGTTGAGLENSGNTVSNNNIFDFLACTGSGSTAGIYLNTSNTAWTISDNSFYETTSLAPTSNVAYYAVYISNTGSNYTISNNYIGGSAPLCGGTPWTKTNTANNEFTAVYASTGTGTASNIQGNTIKNFNFANSASATWWGIPIAGAGDVNVGTTAGNVIGSPTGIESIVYTSVSGQVRGINVFQCTGTINIRNNSIGAIKSAGETNANSSSIYVIYGSMTSGTLNIINNTIGSAITANSIHASSPSTASAQFLHGVSISTGTAACTFSGNLIANLNNAGTTTTALPTSGLILKDGTTTGSLTVTNNTVRNITSADNSSNPLTLSIDGIRLSHTGTSAHTISGNTVQTISNSGAEVVGIVRGIDISFSTTESIIERNFIHDLSVASASAKIEGLYIYGGNVKCQNNIISLGTGLSLGAEISGIKQRIVTTNSLKLYHNTVYIGDTVTGVTANTYALRDQANNTRDFRNNIFDNSRSGGTTGKHYAASYESSTFTCDYNDYYAPNGVLVLFQNVEFNDLSDWSYDQWCDENSLNTAPGYTVNPPGTTANDYRPTVLLAGDSDSGPATDYDSTTRAATPNIGAFELAPPCTNPTSGGVIAANQTVCPNSIPLEITSDSLPSGHTGDLEFQWEQSTTSELSGFTEITGATDTTYQPVALSDTTWFRRLARVSCMEDWVGCDTSNVVKITPQPILISTEPVTGITGTSATLNGNITSTCGTDATNRGFIWYPYSDTLKTIGGYLVTTMDSTGSFGAGVFSKILTGLTPDTRYNARACASNTAEVVYGDSVVFRTSINVPLAPTVDNPSMTTLDITINENGNPANIEYAIHETTLDKFIQSDGKPGASAVWQTAALWGTKTIIELDTATTYIFEVKARNAALTETAYSDTISASTQKCYMGEAWTARTVAVTNLQPMAVTYGNGKFVAVSDGSNKVITSADGITWTAYTAPEANQWRSVTYGNNLFVAVSANGTNRVMTSPDGETWTAQAAAEANSWQSVTYGNGKYVAVARDGTNRVMTSTNGTSWAAAAATEENPWVSVIYANSKFVAVSVGGTKRVMTSTDGITWISQTTTGANQWAAVTYGNGKYVAVAQLGPNQAMTSTDGITWTNQTTPAGPWYAVTYGNGMFVAVGASSGATPVPKKVMTSTDGVTWTAHASADDGSWWRSVAYGNDMFVAVANYNTKLIMTSDCSPVLTVTTQDASTITTTTATGNGTILLAGLTDPTDRGIILYPYTDTDKVIGGSGVTNIHEAGTFGTGTYTASLTTLTVNTRYNARAHATDASNGTTYGSRVDFWTLANVPSAPTVSTPTATTLNVAVNVNANPATTQFAIFDTVTDQYVQANGSLGASEVWQNAATWGTKTVTGLTAGTEYVFKVKARNGGNVETAFGATASGIPLLLPLLITEAVSDITTLSAIGNGDITDIGVDNPTNRGIIWYPYTNTDKIIGGTDVTNVNETGTYDTGAYFVSLPGLALNTHYNARAHATNTDGTGYGSRVDFWTLANVPSVPTLNNPATTTLDVTIGEDDNPAVTEFAIEFSWNPTKWVQATGVLGDNAVWQTKPTWGTKTVTGLSVNTQYTVQVKALNGDNIETDFGTSTAVFTLANTPGAPTVGSPTTSSLDVTINENGNPEHTLYAIHEAGGKYMQNDGTLDDAIVWKTKALWGEIGSPTSTVTVSGLTPNEPYTFSVIAKNGDNIETATSTTATEHTLSNVPGKPTLNGVTASTFDVTLDVNNNPVATEYIIRVKYNTITKYVNSGTGNLQDNADWQTIATWGTKTVSNLAVGVEYTVDVKARNNATPQIETDFGEAETVITCKNPSEAGAIGEDQTICYNTIPDPFTSLSPATDFGGTLEYRWELATESPTLTTLWTEISGTNSDTFSPKVLSETSWYRRAARVDCKDDWSEAVISNTVKITVHPHFTAGEIAATGETICYNTNPSQAVGSTKDADGGFGIITYTWYLSTDGFVTSSEIAGANATTYTPAGTLTTTTAYRRYAQDATCTDPAIASSGTWTVTVEEQLTLSCPDDFDVNTDPDVCTASVTFTATAGGTPTPTLTYAVNNVPITSPFDFLKGTSTVLVTAVNYCGTLTCSFTVTVTDNEYPTIINLPQKVDVDTDEGQCGAVITWIEPTSGDNCSGHSISRITGDPGGSFFDVGTHTITYQATDAVGNKVSESFTITVTDNEKPNVLCQNITINLDATGNATITPADIDNGTTDNCGIVTNTMTLSRTEFSCADMGETYTVTLTVTDIHSNTASCTATTTVNELSVPLVRVSITASKAPNGQVLFKATPVNGGANPTYTWLKNGVEIKGVTGDELISTCSSGDEHSVILISSLPCTEHATSNAMCTY